MKDYRTITLVSRNINCSNITVDEFVEAMFSDFLEAEEKYNDLYIPEWESYKIKSFYKQMEYVHKNAIKFAEKKWKTEKKRNAYIASEIEKARKTYKFDSYYYGLSFFDFDVNPGEIGLSGNCCISYSELTPKALQNMYEEIKDNKYFKKATGWQLTYKAYKNSYQVSFRPQIKLIVDEETANQMKQDEKNLTDAVNKFYEGCTYWGD